MHGQMLLQMLQLLPTRLHGLLPGNPSDCMGEVLPNQRQCLARLATVPHMLYARRGLTSVCDDSHTVRSIDDSVDHCNTLPAIGVDTTYSEQRIVRCNETCMPEHMALQYRKVVSSTQYRKKESCLVQASHKLRNTFLTETDTLLQLPARVDEIPGCDR